MNVWTLVQVIFYLAQRKPLYINELLHSFFDSQVRQDRDKSVNYTFFTPTSDDLHAKTTPQVLPTQSVRQSLRPNRRQDVLPRQVRLRCQQAGV